MFGLHIIVSIHTDKYVDLIQLLSQFSPASPVGIFQLYEDSNNTCQLHLTAECSSLDPLTHYIQTECFHSLVAVIKELGTLDGIKIEKYSSL